MTPVVHLKMNMVKLCSLNAAPVTLDFVVVNAITDTAVIQLLIV